MKVKFPISKFNNPISEKKIDEFINLLDINSTDTIVDFGGGNGEVLLKILNKSDASGILIDLDKHLLESCQKKAGKLIEKEKLKLINQDAKIYLKELEALSIDCAICIGSSHAFDGYLKFITAIKPYLKSDGLVLVGEGFWLKKPSQDYLSILGGDESELLYHHENIEEAEKLGMTYLYSHTASEDDWNRFEGIYFLEKELENLGKKDPEKLKKLEELRGFRRAQFRYGRETMGFGLYLFRNVAFE